MTEYKLKCSNLIAALHIIYIFTQGKTSKWSLSHIYAIFMLFENTVGCKVLCSKNVAFYNEYYQHNNLSDKLTWIWQRLSIWYVQPLLYQEQYLSWQNLMIVLSSMIWESNTTASCASVKAIKSGLTHKGFQRVTYLM